MATVNKNFKIKSGLVVEGTTGTINGENILTEASTQFIIDTVGGSATSNNTPDTVVLRDGSGNFAAGTITADIAGDVTGTVSDISNHNTDDLSEGTTNKYYTDGRVKDVLVNSTKTNIQITEVAGELHITAENGVADSTTDDLTEGSTNKYYSNTLVDNHLTGGDGISYSSGTISADVAGGLHIDGGQVKIDRTTVDSWYDAAGSASTVAGDLTTHISDTSTHGVTGDIVGTSDAQTLSNKEFNGETKFHAANGAGRFSIDLNTSTGATTLTGNNDDLTITTNGGDVVLTPSGTAYYGGTTAADEIATHGYVDNAVAGLAWKQSVNLLYDAAIPVLSGSGATQLAVDGHTVLGDADSGYRILLAAVGGASTDGIYVYESVDGSWTLTRAADADTFSELIGAAVYVMEGTQYGSTSWVQGNHYLTGFTGQSWTQFSGQGSVTAGNGITVNGLEVSIDTNVVATQSDLSTGLGGKQNNLTAGTNIDISNDTVSVTGLASTDISDFNTAALSANNGYWDTLGAASTAEQNANQFTTSELASYTTTVNLESTIDGYGFAYTSEIPSTTDDLTEGATNHYYTDARSQAATADLLTSATLSNITITGDEISGLTITAENGVAGSTTDDLTEGSSNLYYTDQRALDAVANSTIYPTAVEVNDYRKEEATRVSASSTSTVNLHSFQYPYESAKYLVRVVGWVGGVKHSQLTEILMTVDGNENIAISEYGTISTNDANLASFSATESAGVFTLTATVGSVSSCEIVTAATLLSWAD